MPPPPPHPELSPKLPTLYIEIICYLLPFIIASGFISTTPKVLSSTSNSVVNVSEQLGCDLNIIATSTGDLDMERRPFQTTTVTFPGLSPGDYTCESIVNEDGNLLESVGVSCSFGIPRSTTGELLKTHAGVTGGTNSDVIPILVLSVVSSFLWHFTARIDVTSLNFTF